MEIEDLIEKKAEHWKKKLLDLSKKNNLVSYRFSKARSLSVLEPGFSQVAEDLNRGNRIRILKSQGSRKRRGVWFCGEGDSVAKKLSVLYFKTKENFQELGLNTFFAGVGILEYSEPEDSEVLRAPVFLFPLALNRKKPSKNLHGFEIASGSEDVKVNPALAEKLLDDFGIRIPDFKDQSVKGYFDQLRAVLSEKPEWSVKEEVFLDIFYYQKYIMHEDLSAHKKLLKKSPLVRAFLGHKESLQAGQAESSKPEESVEVISADSSQKEAIELAKSGASFVLQGPPGTGKSQTISNIIAALIEKKKKVLFVSQKMAALNIVHRNLAEIGLSRYCLNLHNYRGNKKEVVDQLVAELDRPVLDEPVNSYSFETYLNCQNDLDFFYKALCERKAPRNLSVYDVRGELAKLGEADAVYERLPDSVMMDEKKFAKLFSDMEVLDRILDQAGSPKTSPYFSFDSSKNRPFERERFKSKLIKTWSLLNELADFIDNPAQKAGIETVEDLSVLCRKHDDARKLLEGCPGFFLGCDVQEAERVFSDVFANLSELRKAEKKILGKAGRSFLRAGIQKEEILLRKNSFFGRLFSREGAEKIRELEVLCGRRMSYRSWLEMFEEREKYERHLSYHESAKKNYRDVLSNLESPDSLEELEKVRRKAGNFLDAQDMAVSVGSDAVKTLVFWREEESRTGAVRELVSSLKDLDACFSRGRLKHLQEIAVLKEEFRVLLEGLSKIDSVLSFRKKFDSLPGEIKSFVDKYLEQNSVSKLSSVFLKSYYLQVLDRGSDQIKAGVQLKAEQFKKLGDGARRAETLRIKGLLEREKSEYFSRGYEKEVSVLRRESEKKRNLKPIRSLLEEMPNVAFKLKPCFMMSPLSVSQYINPETTQFDVVIFDEASQIMPEDAVPCLIRAGQLIVAGDTQQLPPTSFFMRDLYRHSVDEELEELDSFLSECATRFVSKPLLWHYRSMNESLIAFSNSFFYKNRLVTFPGSKIKDDSALEFNYVKRGVYDRGRSRVNRAEAREIVSRYKKIRAEFPDMSVGVIAFSTAQENAIREEFRAEGLSVEDSIRPSDEDFFIKNIETVQGDERDIILISLGYGKDSSGKLSYNFGPLNSRGGSKRLNVAVTRSRFRTVIFSSILPEELDSGRINSEGVRFLKYYLEYAKGRDFSRFLPGRHEGFESSFEKSVYEALVKEGFSVDSQVGSSDFRVDAAIKHPEKNEYVLGIEFDGSQHNVSRFARDRDGVRPEILKNLGWNMHRVWSGDWLEDREGELKKIREKVDFLLRSEESSGKTKNVELSQELRVKGS